MMSTTTVALVAMLAVLPTFSRAQCLPGQAFQGYDSEGFIDCFWCNPGTISDGSAESCVPCAPGTYEWDNTNCIECDEYTYQPSYGEASCILCDGFVTDAATACVSETPQPAPTSDPTPAPTTAPTAVPTSAPTPEPTRVPTAAPLPQFNNFTRPTKWQFAAPQACTWTPAVGSSLVYTLHPGNTLFARDPVTGSAAWTFTSTSQKNLVGGAVFDAATNSVVAATTVSLLIFDATTGAVKFDVALPPNSGTPCKEGVPVVASLGAPIGVAAVFATDFGRVFAVKLDSGAIAWNASLTKFNAVSAPVSLWKDKIIVGTYSGKIHVLSAASGVSISSYTAPGATQYIWNGPVFGVRAGMLVVDDILYFSTCTANNNFHALNLATMQPVWATPLTLSAGSFAYTTASVTHDGNIVTTTSDGKLFVVTPAGIQIGMFDTTLKMPVFGPIPVYGDVAFAQTGYGRLYQVRISTGELVDKFWYNHLLGTFSSTPAFDPAARRFYQCGGARDGAMEFT